VEVDYRSKHRRGVTSYPFSYNFASSSLCPRFENLPLLPVEAIEIFLRLPWMLIATTTLTEEERLRENQAALSEKQRTTNRTDWNDVVFTHKITTAAMKERFIEFLRMIASRPGGHRHLQPPLAPLKLRITSRDLSGSQCIPSQRAAIRHRDQHSAADRSRGHQVHEQGAGA